MRRTCTGRCRSPPCRSCSPRSWRRRRTSCETISRLVISVGSRGAGAAVAICTVRSSTFFSVLPLIAEAKLEGLLGTLAARSNVNATSSAVNGDPSCHLTFGRSLNSQTLPSITFQLTARPGISLPVGSVSTSRSNRWLRMALFGVRLWKCGSIAEGSAAKPILRSSAATGVAATIAATTAAPHHPSHKRAIDPPRRHANTIAADEANTRA